MQTLKEQCQNYAPLQHSLVNLENDLHYKKEISCNSWFTITHFQSNGEILDVLYHTMLMQLPQMPTVCTCCLSVTNTTTKEYVQESNAYLSPMVRLSTDCMDLQTRKSHFWGDLDEMHLCLSGKTFKMTADITPTGYPILNGGAGRFPLLNMDVSQYSLPTMETTGSLQAFGKKYPIQNGITWLDRQWQNIHGADMIWGWMNLNLSNGVIISLWFPIDHGIEKPFATVLFPDGIQEVVSVNPVAATGTNFWKSNVCKNDYPTYWRICIPEYHANLEIVTEIPDQELQFRLLKSLNHYEAASKITGTFDGHPITGHCFVELMALKTPWTKIIAQLNG